MKLLLPVESRRSICRRWPREIRTRTRRKEATREARRVERKSQIKRKMSMNKRTLSRRKKSSSLLLNPRRKIKFRRCLLK
jgi:hypothetical protein